MPGRRSLLFSAVFAIALLSGTSARAQYAATRVVHDWTITLFGGRFGYEQTLTTPWGGRTTRLHWGGGNIRVPSGPRTREMLPVIGVSLAVAALVLWRIRAKRRAVGSPALGDRNIEAIG